MKTEVPETLSRELFYLMRRAAEHVVCTTDRILTPALLDGVQLSVLIALRNGKTWNQEQLAKVVGVNRNRMVAILDALEFRKWVKREKNPDNRRAHKVTLTPEGHQGCTEALALLRTTQPPYVRGVGSEHLEYLRWVLKLVIETPAQWRIPYDEYFKGDKSNDDEKSEIAVTKKSKETISRHT